MRSESDGHCLPASFPGLAVRAAVRRRSPVPLVETLFDRYHPTVDEFLEHVEEVRERTGWDESFRPARVERVRAADGRASTSTGAASSPTCSSRPAIRGSHVPDGARRRPARRPRVRAARVRDTVAVVGAGMAAATEWLNALAAGAEVVSVRRREPARRPLNLPRALFSRRGLAGYHATPPEERALLLAAGSRRPTRPAAPGTSRSSAQPARGASASSRR